MTDDSRSGVPSGGYSICEHGVRSDQGPCPVCSEVKELIECEGCRRAKGSYESSWISVAPREFYCPECYECVSSQQVNYER